jgi:hypothetical protein
MQEGYYKIFCISRLALKNVAVYIGGSNSKVRYSMMWFKRLPNVVITRYDNESIYDVALTRAFRRNGKLWCVWRNDYMLLKDDGSCVGDTTFPMRWEAI